VTPYVRSLALATVAAGLVALGGPRLRAQSADQIDLPDLPLPTATAHAPIPETLDDIWIAPSAGPTSSMQALARAARLVADGRFTEAEPLVKKASLADTPLTDYQRYYTALIDFKLGRVDAARSALEALVAGVPTGYLSEGARRLAGDVAESQKDFAAATGFYAPLTRMKTLEPDDAWVRLGRAKQGTGDIRGAAEAYAHVYFEYPFSDQSAAASAEIDALNAWEPLEAGSPRYKLELGRAEQLFGGRRYADARDAFKPLAPLASGDDNELIALRLAECDYYLKRYQSARDALDPWTKSARRQAEAMFFAASATRGIGDETAYVQQVRTLVEQFPTSSWAEEALNNLGSHYIIADQDDDADAVFRQLVERFPDGRYAQRASWKVGWNAYRTGRWADCAAAFERAATAYPRSDYRPSWLYWAARSREQLGDGATGDRLYGVLVADYANSYYGRLATRQLTARHVEPMTLAAAVAPADPPVPAVSQSGGDDITNADLIRALITAGLYDDALNELRWVQKTSGDSTRIQATIGYVYSQQGDLRRGINAVKRAFPQYLSSNGGDLPTEVLQVLFPVAYWDLIKRYGTANQLDPYLLAALIAQESTFDAGIVSHANAIGLMQIVPSTGRSYARRLRIRHYSTRKLTDATVNMQIGTSYFADLVDRFGGVPYALASYNAGPGAVARWVAERPGIAMDEFIDDIPYPETQNYVRKILGTAEDYRQLYGDGRAVPLAGAPGSQPLPGAKTTASHTKKPAAKTPAKKTTKKRRVKH
jgi:soluble lytic murein transglycosylase